MCIAILAFTIPIVVWILWILCAIVCGIAFQKDRERFGRW